MKYNVSFIEITTFEVESDTEEMAMEIAINAPSDEAERCAIYKAIRKDEEEIHSEKEVVAILARQIFSEEKDNDGQILFYTGLMENETGSLVPFSLDESHLTTNFDGHDI